MPRQPKNTNKISREFSDHILTSVAIFLSGGERPDDDYINYVVNVLFSITDGDSLEKATQRKRGRKSEGAASKAFHLVWNLIAEGKAKNKAQAYELAAKELGYTDINGPRQVERYCKEMLEGDDFVFPGGLREV